MKHLANCTPREFLTQTMLIKHAVADWISKIDFRTIMKSKPEITDDMTKEEKNEAWSKQTNHNLGLIYEEMAEHYPDETLNLLALICFIDPKDVDKHPVQEYLTALSEMLGSNAVISFFISLVRLERTGIFRR